ARRIRAPAAPPRAASTQLATSALANLPSRVLLVHHDGTAPPPDHERTVFPFERLQRVPDLHRLTFLPTCSSTNPTPDGIPTAKSGSRIATQAPLDRAMSAPAPTQRWNRSTFDSGQAPSHGMTPVCSRSRM